MRRGNDFCGITVNKSGEKEYHPLEHFYHADQLPDVEDMLEKRLSFPDLMLNLNEVRDAHDSLEAEFHSLFTREGVGDAFEALLKEQAISQDTSIHFFLDLKNDVILLMPDVEGGESKQMKMGTDNVFGKAVHDYAAPQLQERLDAQNARLPISQKILNAMKEGSKLEKIQPFFDLNPNKIDYCEVVKKELADLLEKNDLPPESVIVVHGPGGNIGWNALDNTEKGEKFLPRSDLQDLCVHVRCTASLREAAKGLKYVEGYTAEPVMFGATLRNVKGEEWRSSVTTLFGTGEPGDGVRWSYGWKEGYIQQNLGCDQGDTTADRTYDPEKNGRYPYWDAEGNAISVVKIDKESFWSKSGATYSSKTVWPYVDPKRTEKERRELHGGLSAEKFEAQHQQHPLEAPMRGQVEVLFNRPHGNECIGMYGGQMGPLGFASKAYGLRITDPDDPLRRALSEVDESKVFSEIDGGYTILGFANTKLLYDGQGFPLRQDPGEYRGLSFAAKTKDAPRGERGSLRSRVQQTVKRLAGYDCPAGGR